MFNYEMSYGELAERLNKIEKYFEEHLPKENNCDIKIEVPISYYDYLAISDIRFMMEDKQRKEDYQKEKEKKIYEYKMSLHY